MKIRSPIIASGSGSLAGLTLSHNRGGIYLRARATPTNPSSAPQVEVRAIFGNLSSAWQTITTAQRAAWETYAANVPVTNALGESKNLTGHQMYVRNNTARIQAGLARVDDGPVVFASDALSPVAIVAAEVGLIVGITFVDTDDWVNEDDAGLLVYGARQFAPTINYFKGPYLFTGILQGDSVTPPTTPDTSLTSLFPWTAGNFTSFRVLSVRADGRISPVQFLGPDIILT